MRIREREDDGFGRSAASALLYAGMDSCQGTDSHHDHACGREQPR